MPVTYLKTIEFISFIKKQIIESETVTFVA
jgi:hypothetical protein